MKRFVVLVVFFALVQTIRGLPKPRPTTQSVDKAESLKDDLKGPRMKASLWGDLVETLKNMSEDEQGTFTDDSLHPSRQQKRTVSLDGKPLFGAPPIPKGFQLSGKNVDFTAASPNSNGKPLAPFPTFPLVTVYIKSASGELRQVRLILHPGMTLNDALQQADNRFLLKHPLEASPFACDIAMSIENQCLVYASCGKVSVTKSNEWIITVTKNGEMKYRSPCIPGILMSKGDEVLVEYLPRKEKTSRG